MVSPLENRETLRTTKTQIVSIQIKGYSAVVEAELYWPEIFYYDFLTLIKINDEWKIVHKTWYEEPLSK